MHDLGAFSPNQSNSAITPTDGKKLACEDVSSIGGRLLNIKLSTYHSASNEDSPPSTNHLSVQHHRHAVHSDGISKLVGQCY